jgi:hypothetical protein
MADTARSDLVYNIVEQSLVGNVDGKWINARAVSGGRAGSKTHGVVEFMRANNPYATGVKKSSTVAGGPLPMVTYYLKTHESRPSWIRLIPLANNAAMRGRDGFAIHGRGKRGSDGCIVPTDFNVVQLLYKLVKAREDAGKPAPTLAVVAIGDLERFDRLNRTA